MLTKFQEFVGTRAVKFTINRLVFLVYNTSNSSNNNSKLGY